MKIALYSRPNNPSLDIIRLELERRGVDFVFNPSAPPESCDLALSFGGDGTFLSTVRKLGELSLPVLGINTGRLGFMAAVALEDIGKSMDAILDGRYTVEERTLLAVSGGISGVAVNEFTVQKQGTTMISVGIEIDQETVASYWADGVIVSTSTGSTAYSLSVGGAILAPGCQCLILSPIAPHNMNIRPLVVPDTSSISLRVSTRNGADVIATIDNQECLIGDGTEFLLERSSQVLRVVRLEGSSFYNALRAKLFWGVDARDGSEKSTPYRTGKN